MQPKQPAPTIHEFLYTHNYNSPTPAGVYMLYDVISDRGYVGSTQDLTYRAGQHFKALELGLHHNRELQYIFDSNGAEALSFIVLERCAVEDLKSREQLWVDRFSRHKGMLVNKQLTVRRPEKRP